MGLIRKMTSIGTAGLVDFRSDKERIARNTKATARAVRDQNRLLAGQATPPAPASAAPAELGPSNEQFLAQLERLAALHATGALTDAEYTDAKRQLLPPAPGA